MFEIQEEQIRELVKKANAPVLGLLGGLIPAAAREAIQADVHTLPSARTFAQRLDKYPALFGVWLAEHVMKGIGATGHFDVYPHVQKAIGGVAELSTPDRELLWRAFRRAMFKLGIQPLPRTYGSHYMIDEYARQAGVPIAFADDLASRMLQLAKRIGLPDEEDQEGLLTWQSTLLNRLQPPFSATARKAVERDVQAYYTRAFLRVYANHGQASAGDALEAALAVAFVRDGGTGFIRRAAIPQLLYRDGVLGVLFPPSNGASAFELQCGQSTVVVQNDEQGTFRQLPAGLPAEVLVHGADGERLLSCKLWPDSASNRLLVFNDAGRLRASAQLGQSDPVELPPGQYVALCRFTPTNIVSCEEVSDSPHLTELLIEIRPGAEMSIANGPAQVTLIGQNLPTFRLEGLVKAGLERIEFHYGPLLAKVEIPQEWQQIGPSSYELRISSGEFSCSLPIDLAVDGTGSARLDLELKLTGIKPGLRRLVVELARIGEVRTLQRQSTLYWIGLDRVTYGLRFAYDSKPDNLISSACRALKFGPACAEPIDDASRVLRMGFDVGGGRVVHLSWNRPGVFVEVESRGNDGESTVVARPLGSTETVSLTTQKNILVSASEPGFLTLGAWRQFVDFGHRPSKLLPGAFLASRLEPGAHTLTYETQAGAASVPLLVLSQPHVATAISTCRLANVLEIKVTVLGEPSAVAVTGKALTSGRESKAELELLAGMWRTNDLARMQVYSVPNGSSHEIYILVDVETLQPGAWCLDIGARIGGLWGRLEDTTEGHIGVAFAIDNVGQEISGPDVIEASKLLDEREVVQRLGRLNSHFRQYWSPVCWDQQSWLSLYWSALVERLKEHEAEFIAELADMAMARGADDVRQGFLPKQSIAASLPNIFCLPRREYRKVHIKPHPLSVALKAMPEFRGSVVAAFGLTIHPAVVTSFANAAQVMRMARPEAFSLVGYRQALGMTQLEDGYRLDDESFLPGPGELLGPLHLAHAWRDMERGYASSAAMPMPRKSLAVALARLLQQRRPVFGQSAPEGIRGQTTVNQLRAFAADGVDEVEQQRQETLMHIANACSWLAWYCRLEVRQEGEFGRFRAVLIQLRKEIEMQANGVDDCIAYYLNVAPAMFAYYLLLWELVLTVELDTAAQDV